MCEFRSIEEWRRGFVRCHLESGTCLVLHTLSLFASGVGEGFAVPISELSQRTSLSGPIVTKHLKKAERAGWLAAQRWDGTGAKLRQNRYLLKFPEMEVEGWE